MKHALVILLSILHAAAYASEAEDPSLSKPVETVASQPAIDWRARVASAKPTASEILYVTVHSAADCPYCKEWKKSKMGQAVASLIANARPNVRFVVIERDSLNGKEEASAYPQDLMFEYERRLRRKQLSPAVPVFEIFLSGALVYRASGLSMWRTHVVPAIIEIEKSRDQIQGAEQPGTLK